SKLAKCTDTPTSFTCTCPAGSTSQQIADPQTQMVNQECVTLLDMSALLIHDTIVNNGAAAGLDKTQDNLNNGQAYELITQAVAGATAKGLPDDASFALSTMPSHPALKLAWDNTKDEANSRILKPGDASIDIMVPAGNYKNVQIYALATNAP